MRIPDETAKIRNELTVHQYQLRSETGDVDEHEPQRKCMSSLVTYEESGYSDQACPGYQAEKA